jgi:hypothetical protein
VCVLQEQEAGCGRGRVSSAVKSGLLLMIVTSGRWVNEDELGAVGGGGCVCVWWWWWWSSDGHAGEAAARRGPLQAAHSGAEDATFG